MNWWVQFNHHFLIVEQQFLHTHTPITLNFLVDNNNYYINLINFAGGQATFNSPLSIIPMNTIDNQTAGNQISVGVVDVGVVDVLISIC